MAEWIVHPEIYCIYILPEIYIPSDGFEHLPSLVKYIISGSGYSCSLSLSSFKSGSYGYGSLRISVPGIYLSI